ncbi:MAG TPA: histidine phosphatase family protein [Anaerolineales bacterium]|nr:histidine phosphatase family protein [Anaerolineales bacterium]
MKLYFVRHGESEANTLRVISNRESRFGLTALGKEQAMVLADSLKDIPITSIFSSPVLRARETADILSRSFNLPYQSTEALREYDCGILEEKSDEESWKLHSEIAEDWVLHHNHLRKPEGGENFLDIKKRFVPFIERFAQNGLHPEDHILLVSHGGLLQLMLPEVLTNIDHAFVRSNGIRHTQCIIAEQRSTGLLCLQWSDIKFSNTYT